MEGYEGIVDLAYKKAIPKEMFIGITEMIIDERTAMRNKQKLSNQDYENVIHDLNEFNTFIESKENKLDGNIKEVVDTLTKAGYLPDYTIFNEEVRKENQKLSKRYYGSVYNFLKIYRDIMELLTSKFINQNKEIFNKYLIESNLVWEEHLQDKVKKLIKEYDSGSISNKNIVKEITKLIEEQGIYNCNSPFIVNDVSLINSFKCESYNLPKNFKYLLEFFIPIEKTSKFILDYMAHSTNKSIRTRYECLYYVYFKPGITQDEGKEELRKVLSLTDSTIDKNLSLGRKMFSDLLWEFVDPKNESHELIRKVFVCILEFADTKDISIKSFMEVLKNNFVI